jgi:hypothetical protein
MSQSPHAIRTARRNLVLRVERFFAAISNGLQPNVDAMASFALAIECLERDDHPTGEDAMMRAEMRRLGPPRQRPEPSVVYLFEITTRRPLVRRAGRKDPRGPGPCPSRGRGPLHGVRQGSDRGPAGCLIPSRLT